MNKATLRLFNGIYVPENERGGEISPQFLARCVKRGFVCQEEIPSSDELLDTISSVVGISGEKANSSFHKSWAKVKDAPIEQLVIEQMVHYITTYGFEHLGIYSEDTVYIPQEELDIPEISDDLPLVVIEAMNAEDLRDGIMELATSGIALSEQSIRDIYTIVETDVIDLSDQLDEIENRELKAMLRDYYGVVPTEPEEFLRHVISKLTDETLIIKNDYLINKIKESSGKFLDELMKDAPPDLASIFFRYKPLFLAMKSISRDNTFYNRLRKKADKMHEPLQPDYLNNVTAQIKNNTLDLGELERRLENASIWRKIRLAYALAYRMEEPESILYRIRNGKAWVEEFDFPTEGKLVPASDIVERSIADSLRGKVEGKPIYIPEGIEYTLPATQKQFVGNIPGGSSVEAPEDMIAGVYWENQDPYRVDLDLSLISAGRGKVGWDSSYRTDDVLFSGDITDAPDGATELFYIRETQPNPMIVMLNYYNYNENVEVPTKILVAKERADNFQKNYMVDVNNILAQTIMEIDQKQNILGVIMENRFYFYHATMGNMISSRNDERTQHARNYLVTKATSGLKLRNVLMLAGANVVTEKPVEQNYLNLSPEHLDKQTIIGLFQ